MAAEGSQFLFERGAGSEDALCALGPESDGQAVEGLAGAGEGLEVGVDGGLDGEEEAAVFFLQEGDVVFELLADVAALGARGRALGARGRGGEVALLNFWGDVGASAEAPGEVSGHYIAVHGVVGRERRGRCGSLVR